MKKYLLIIAIPLFLVSCYYDTEEDLYPCDFSPDQITYAEDIQPIVQNNCLVCHNQSARLGDVVLEGYENLKFYVDNGKFLAAITHQNGVSPMPKGSPQLSDCTIKRIKLWIDKGAPND